jgi:hypothetical protein
MEGRHQVDGPEDRLILHRLAADLADHFHPLLNLIEGAFILGAIARWLRLGLDIGDVGHDQSYSDYSLVEHDLFGKPVSTFPDHAPAFRSRTPLSQTTLTDSCPPYEIPMVMVNGAAYLPRRSRT